MAVSIGNAHGIYTRLPVFDFDRLEKIRKAVRSAAPVEATEAISYQIPTFKYQGGLVAFAAFSKHCSFFPMSMAVIAQFKEELKRLETSKGTIRFPLE